MIFYDNLQIYLKIGVDICRLWFRICQYNVMIGLRCGSFCRNATDDGGVMLKAIRLFFDPQAIGAVLIFAGAIIFSSFVIAGLYLDMAVVEGLAGFWWSVVAFALFPLTLIVVPWFALLAHGSWAPMVVCYGGMMGGALVLVAGMWMKAGPCVVLMVFSPAGKPCSAPGKTCRESMEGFI